MAFITEQVPQSFIDTFDATRLRGEFGLGSMPTNPSFDWSIWTVDKECDVAFMVVDSNSITRRTADDTLPRRTWYALLWHDRLISFETTTGGYATGGKDPKYGRSESVKIWDDTDIWLDDDLIDKMPEILELARVGYYVSIDGPELPWIKGVEIHVRSINDKVIGATA